MRKNKQKNFKEIQDMIKKIGFTINKDQSQHTYFHYTVVNNHTNDIYNFKYKGGMVELYNAINENIHDFESFVKDNSFINKNKISKKHVIINKKKIKNYDNIDDNTFVSSIIKKRNDNIEFASKINNYVMNYNVKIPKHYDNYYFPNCIDNIVNRIKLGRPIFINGNAGTGKTELIYKLGKIFNQKVLRVNFSVGTTEANLIGKFIVKNQETVFIDGVLPTAMKNGWWILFDEIDYAMPEHLAVLQPVLEGDNLIITINQNEEIIPHNNFRMFATANTKGRGDETQSFTGTNFLNLAFLDRWSIFELTYTQKEKDIIINLLNDEIISKQIYDYFQLLRNAAKNGEILNAVFSTRRIVQVCETLKIGEPLKDVLNYEIWSRYDNNEMNLMKELAYDIWDKNNYFSKKWVIGDEHITINKEENIQSQIVPITESVNIDTIIK